MRPRPSIPILITHPVCFAVPEKPCPVRHLVYVYICTLTSSGAHVRAEGARIHTCSDRLIRKMYKRRMKHCTCVNVYARRVCNYAYALVPRDWSGRRTRFISRRYLYPSAFGTRVIKRPRDLFPRTLAARGGSADPVLLPVYNYDLLRIPIRRDTARISARAKGFRGATSEGYDTPDKSVVLFPS